MIESFAKVLKSILKNCPEVNEQFNEIEAFSKLDSPSKNKYLRYIKYVRSGFDNGLEEFSSSELLDLNRFCTDCGKELYSKDDETRTILEFNSPRKSHEILEEIICKNNEEEEEASSEY